MEEVNKLLKSLGYTEYDISEITNTYPISDMKEGTLINNIKRNYTFLVKLGYSQEEVITMTKYFPTIYSYSIENIQQKIKDIKQLGYSQEEVIKMTKSLPAIYGHSIENIQQKIEFYDYINLHSLAIVSTKSLMQSTALSYAKYMFFLEKGIKIDETNYSKLFLSKKRFQKQYGITKEKLLEKYNYEKDFKGKSTLELVVEAQETIGEDISYIDDTEQVMTKQENQIEEQENSQKGE